MKKIIILVLISLECGYLVLSMSSIVLSPHTHIDYTEASILEQGEGTGVVTPETVLPAKGIYTVEVYMDVEDTNISIITKGTDPTIGNMLGSETVYLENGEDYFVYDIYARLNGISTQTFVYTDLRNEESTATINRISIDYQKWHTFSYYLISIIFWFSLIDVLMYVVFFRKDPVIDFIKERGFICITFVFAVLIASLPLMVKDIPVGDDLPFHLIRIQGIADGLKSGYFPVKIHDNWFNGFGMPAGVFYGQILLYPSAVLRVLGFPLGHTYRIYVIFVNILTVLVSYLTFQKMSKDRYFAAATAVFYTFALYRLMDIHKRSAVGEYTAMVFLPIVLLGVAILYDYIETESKDHAWVYIAIGMTGVLQSHMLTVFMLFIAGGITVLLNIKRTFCKETLVQFGKSIILIILLNLFYIIPFIDYYFGYSLKMKDMKKDIAAKAAYLPEIFSQVYDVNGMNGEHTPVGDMPMSIGVSAIFIFATVIFVVCIKGSKTYKRIIRDVAIVLSVFVFLASDLFPYNYLREYCKPIYDIFQKMQYPWRFLTIVTIMCTCMFSVSLLLLSTHYGKKVALLYALVILSITFLQSKRMEDSIIHEYVGKSYYSMTDTFWNECEYLPRNTEIEQLYDTKLLTSDAGVTAMNYVRRGISSTLEVSNTTGEIGYVQLPQLCYPHFRAIDKDGKDLEVIIGDYYKMCFAVPSGYKGTVHVFFQEPITWRISEIVSLITISLLILKLIRIAKLSPTDP